MVFITGNVHILKNVMDEIVLTLLEFYSIVFKFVCTRSSTRMYALGVSSSTLHS